MAELNEFDKETQLRLMRVGFALPHEYPKAALLDFLELLERKKRLNLFISHMQGELQEIAQRHGVRW